MHHHHTKSPTRIDAYCGFVAAFGIVTGDHHCRCVVARFAVAYEIFIVLLTGLLLSFQLHMGYAFRACIRMLEEADAAY